MILNEEQVFMGLKLTNYANSNSISMLIVIVCGMPYFMLQIYEVCNDKFIEILN